MSDYVTEYENEQDFNDAWHYAEQKQLEKDRDILNSINQEYPHLTTDIQNWIEDNEVKGFYEVVESPVGEYQEFDEIEDYKALKGHWVNQSYCSWTDYYSGTVTIKLSDAKYLSASFSS